MANETSFDRRLARHRHELRQVYDSLYHDAAAYDYFEGMLRRMWQERSATLKRLDARREKNPDWYRGRDLLGMLMYTEAFGGTLKGVQEKLDYLQEAGVNYLHLMPLLESPEGRSDGGYAVADFRKVQPQLGTMEDLAALTDDCHRRGMAVCWIAYNTFFRT